MNFWFWSINLFLVEISIFYFFFLVLVLVSNVKVSLRKTYLVDRADFTFVFKFFIMKHITRGNVDY